MGTDVKLVDERFREYYSTGKYHGFRVLRETDYKLSGCHHVTFSDHNQEIFAMGLFKEQALKRAFDKIDQIIKEN